MLPYFCRTQIGEFTLSPATFIKMSWFGFLPERPLIRNKAIHSLLPFTVDHVPGRFS